MIGPWLNLSLLALESQWVVALRCRTMAWGGPAAWNEAQLMVSEKIAASQRAACRLMSGASHDAVVSGCRETVHANALRLQG